MYSELEMPSEEEEEEVTPEHDGQIGPYMTIREEFKNHNEYKFAETVICNQIRWKLLTFDGSFGKKKSNQSTLKTVLHIAAEAGLRDFCTMIITEAKLMGVVKNIIDVLDSKE